VEVECTPWGARQRPSRPTLMKPRDIVVVPGLSVAPIVVDESAAIWHDYDVSRAGVAMLLVRRFRRERGDDFLKTWIAPQRIPIGKQL
jgi:hypothetical protein